MIINNVNPSNPTEPTPSTILIMKIACSILLLAYCLGLPCPTRASPQRNIPYAAPLAMAAVRLAVIYIARRPFATQRERSLIAVESEITNDLVNVTRETLSNLT